MKSNATNGESPRGKSSDAVILHPPKLREERNELLLNQLNEYEVRDREYRQAKYREARLSETNHLSCNSREQLLADWTNSLQDISGISRETLTLRLINHARHCPQCVELPVPMPWGSTAD
jgi:hypothetical protein